MAGETVSSAEDQTVVSEWSIIDQIAEAHRHISPPEGAFTVEDYVQRVEMHGSQVSYQTALRVLRAEVKAGRLDGDKFVTGDRERWHFWENHA